MSELMQEFTNSGEGFQSRQALVGKLNSQKLFKFYDLTERPGVGWIGILKESLDPPDTSNQETSTAPEEPEPVKTTWKCRVLRANVDEANKSLVISVTANSISGRKQFHPGQEVDLTEAQINILIDSVEDTQIAIPPTSAIYESPPDRQLQLASNFFPDMQPVRNNATGMITMVKHAPNYIIQPLEHIPILNRV